LEKKIFGKDLNENLKAFTKRKKMDRIVELKWHTRRYSICVDGEHSNVFDIAVGTDWGKKSAGTMWDGEE
jgi:hypothetical protein